MHESPYHGQRRIRGQKQVPLSRLHEGRFGRMFRKLRPAPDYGNEEENLARLQELAEQMREPGPEPNQPSGWGSPAAPPPVGDNPNIPAVYTYFGQFVDHDITFDPVSRLQADNDPDALHDFRSPRFDLDSLYGSGPEDEPFHYDRQRHLPPEERALAAPFLIGANEAGQPDLPRTHPLNEQGQAIIGDPRNDENIIISQLQLLFLGLHNKLVAALDAADGRGREERFADLQRQVRWHYQWIVALDFLPRIVGEETMARVWPTWRVTAGLETPTDAADVPCGGAATSPFELCWFRPKNQPFMPVEFSVAAFRFGHSMVRNAYHLNTNIQDVPIFLPGDPGEFGDLRGFRPLPNGWSIEWQHFVSLDGSDPQPSRLIDSKLSAGLFDLPEGGGSLALRNLQRGQALGLPGGQDVARLLGAEVLSAADLGISLDPAPLWFYVLKEAELKHNGQHLGQVGGTIVAETLLGLLAFDPSSWINRDPTWRPTIPAEGGFELADLIAFARS